MCINVHKGTVTFVTCVERTRAFANTEVIPNYGYGINLTLQNQEGPILNVARLECLYLFDTLRKMLFKNRFVVHGPNANDQGSSGL